MTLFALEIALLALAGYALVCGLSAWIFLRGPRREREALRREAEEIERRADALFSRWPP